MGNQSLQNKTTAYWAVIFLPLISQSPVMDFTMPGVIFRFLGIAILVILFFKVILKRGYSTSIWENTFVLYMLLIGVISLVAGLYADTFFDVSLIIKFYLLNFLIYVVAKSFYSVKEIKYFFHLYYLLCIFASIQAVIALTAEFFGLRDLWQVPISDGRDDYRYFLSWAGILGGDVGNGRANFYFSEATHFAHFLFPGIAYALGLKRWHGLIILLAGFTCTFAGAAGLVLITFLIIWSAREASIKNILISLPIAALGFLMFYFYVNLDPDFYRRMFDRETSILDKLSTFHHMYLSLLTEPFGLGIFNAPSYFGSLINTSPGLFNWSVWFGVLAIPPVAVILWTFFKFSFYEINDSLFTTMSLGLLFLTIATFSHGPTPKYFMVFFYGCLMRYRMLSLKSR
jgi:hypothetical protein